jgi:hypothetical protein
MQRRIVVGVLGIVALAVAGGWWMRVRREAPRTEHEAATPTVAQGATATADAPPAVAPEAAVAAPSNAPAAAAPRGDATPAAELPLRDEIADLDRRARSGDAAAACRLGAELLRCERARTLQPYTDNVEIQARALAQRNLREQEMDRQIDAALQRQEENAAVLTHCEGVDEARWMVPARYFHLAAQAGHRPSMRQFLNPERVRSDQLFRDPELIPLYRANAPRYFLQLMEEGDRDLLMRWSMSAALPRDPLRELLPPPYNDPGFAAAMQRQGLAARGIAEPMPPAQPPTAEQLAEAERLYARYFAPRQSEQEERPPRFMASPYDLESYDCDEMPRALSR